LRLVSAEAFGSTPGLVTISVDVDGMQRFHVRLPRIKRPERRCGVTAVEDLQIGSKSTANRSTLLLSHLCRPVCATV
jgi:hypothetical protein